MEPTNYVRLSSIEKMDDCVEKIKEQAKPNDNDMRMLKYVNYINTFLKHFGEERVYLVGSTGDGTKLSLPADDGDNDYLIVSGQLKVPVDCLEFKTNCLSYTWVRGDRIPECEKLDLGDGTYLDANLLRDITPELFSVVRGIYLHLSANTDRLKQANDSVTSLGLRSKVGLAHTTYRHIEIHGDIEKYRQDRLQEKECTGQESFQEIKSSSAELHPDDARIIRRVYEMVQIAKRPGDQETFHGHFPFFATLLEEAIKETPNTTDAVPKAVDSEIVQNKQTPKDVSVDNQEYTDITMVYKRTGNKDFVPSLKVHGQLECMEHWKKRVIDAGLDKESVDDIYNTDVFLISRESLVNPDRSKDFCLAFGLHEQKLVGKFSERQKITFLMLKTLRKGLFDLQMQEHKLRTYHMKTIAFWKFEEELKSAENYESGISGMFQNLNKALHLLKLAVESKSLKHYFTGDNLFANFDDNDFRVIAKTLEGVLVSPIESMINALDIGQAESKEVVLTKEEVYLLLDLNADGGKGENIRRVREAMCNIINGLNRFERRDCLSRSNLKAAILEVTRLILEDEISYQKSDEAIENSSRSQGNNFVQFGGLFKSVHEIVKKDQKKSKEHIDMVVNFASLLSNIVPKINKEMNKIGGAETIKTVLEGAAGMDSDTDAVNIDELMVLLEKFLTCPDEDKNRIGNELKVKFACIFF